MPKNMTNQDLYKLLQIATGEGAVSTVKFLLDLDLNVDGDSDENDYGPPLFTAVEYGYPDVVKLFLERGANPDLEADVGRLPLIAACEYSDETMARLLLDHGADIDARDGYDEQAPIHSAVYNGCLRVVELFCERGAMLETEWPEPDHDPHEPKTPLMLAVTNFVHGLEDRGLDILETILDHGANVNATNELGKTALMYAAADNSAEAVEILLAYGANPLLKDNSGETALDKTQDKRARLLLYCCHLYSRGCV